MVEFTSPKHPKFRVVLCTNHIRVVSKCRNYKEASHEEVIYDD